jgi:hypothetical protein
MLSIIIRVFGGVIGLAMLFTMIKLGHIPQGTGRYGWFMPLMPILFIVYAIGGPKIFTFFGRKEESEELDDEKSKK